MHTASELIDTVQLPLLQRVACGPGYDQVDHGTRVEPATFDEAAGTIEVVWTTGARVKRYDWLRDQVYEEELVVSPDAVDMSRFDAGAVNVIDTHRAYGGVAAILGVVTRAWLDGAQGRAHLKLSRRPDLAGVVADIKAGVIRNVSVGYNVQTYEVTLAADRTDGGKYPLYRATRWVPSELSFVPIGADMHAGTRSNDTQATPCAITRRNGATTMQKQETEQLTRAQIDDHIRTLGKRHRMPAAFVNDLVQRGVTLENAGRSILEEMARLDEAAGGHRNGSSFAFEPRNRAEASEQMVEALAARMGGQSVGPENAYRHVRLVEMARECLELDGVRTVGLSPVQLIERAVGMHTTTDFSALLTEAGNRTLRAAYAALPSGLKPICRQSTVPDFRAKQRLMLGEAPALLKVNEHGEFKHGTMAEAKSTYTLATYGRIFAISRQALVNDDLDAFGEVASKFARASYELEAGQLATLLTSNPAMTYDNVALFHATHGNLGTGAGSALSVTSLDAARKAMRLQKGLDGATPIDVTPKFLVVPAALETTAEQLLTAILANQVSNVNVFATKLQLVVEPRLDAVSATAWYLAADPVVVDTLEYGYLEGEEGPQMSSEIGFEVDGVQVKCRLDFGAGAIEHRGLYKANGA